MKKNNLIKLLILGLWICCTTIAYPALPLWTFKPLTATTFSVSPTETALVKYQVINQSKKTHALIVKTIPGISQIITAGTCAAPFILAYQHYCTLTLLIKGDALQGDVIGGPVVCQQGNPLQCYQPSLDNVLHISKVKKPPLIRYKVAATGDAHLTVIPTLQMVPTHTIAKITVTPTTGFKAILATDSCGGTLSDNTYTSAAITANCLVSFKSQPLPILTAAGIYYHHFPGFSTIDSGANWLQGTTAINSNFQALSTSCIGTGIDAFCSAVGFVDDGGPLLLYQSKDGGLHWNRVSLAIATGLVASFNSTSCSGTGNNALCTAVGSQQDVTNTTIPLLYQSIDGGTNWNAVPTTTSQGIFNTTSCSGTGNSAICTAVGQDLVSNTPLLYQSKDGGAHWTRVALTSEFGSLTTTSCTGTGSSAVCIAAGYLGDGSGAPLLYQTTDGGTTWAMVTTTSNQGIFNSTSCTKTLNTVVCSAVGQDNTSNKALLYQTIDHGATWSAVITTNDDAVFNATSCTPIGNIALCTAAGVDNTTSTPLLYQSTIGSSLWSPVIISSTQGFFSSTSCSRTGNTALCAAVGLDTTNSTPLLYQSQNGGITWSPVIITQFIGAFTTTSCTGTTCVTLGGQPYPSPLLSYSIDGGKHWDLASIATPYGLFTSTSCSGLADTAMCTAVGQDASNSHQLPLLYQSNNGGRHWSAVNTTSDTAIFNATSCTGAAGNAICNAVGQNTTQNNSPLLFQTRNEGITWNPVITPNSPGAFLATSCTGISNSALCTAVGYLGGDTITGIPLLYQSINGGITWSLVTTTNNPGYFQATSCSGTGKTAICVAVGQDVSNNGTPLLYQSTNGGNTWTAVTTINSSGIFKSASCTGTGNTAVCTAVGFLGFDEQSGTPLLYQTTNGGLTWNSVSTTSDLAVFNASSCTGAGETSLCTAVGQNSQTNIPLLYQSTNGGITWNSVTTTLEAGTFNATSCTGTGSTALCTAVGDYVGKNGSQALNGTLLYQSSNGGASWHPVLPTKNQGRFVASSTTSGAR
ncbi:MAG: hypothetical protein PSV35_04435 [bacterium]|nr:hypothetical protein [bacterium]